MIPKLQINANIVLITNPSHRAIFKYKLKIINIDSRTPAPAVHNISFPENISESCIALKVTREEGNIMTWDSKPGEYSEYRNVVAIWKKPFVKKIICTAKTRSKANLDFFWRPQTNATIKTIMTACEAR